MDGCKTLSFHKGGARKSPHQTDSAARRTSNRLVETHDSNRPTRSQAAGLPTAQSPGKLRSWFPKIYHLIGIATIRELDLVLPTIGSRTEFVAS